jgi:hypothetical protein
MLAAESMADRQSANCSRERLINAVHLELPNSSTTGVMLSRSQSMTNLERGGDHVGCA